LKESTKYGFHLDKRGWFGIRDDDWLNHAHTALVCIDMQNFVLKREWAQIGTTGTGTGTDSQKYFYERAERAAIPNTKKLLEYFRKQDLPVVHVALASRFNSLADLTPIWRLRFDQHAEDSGHPYSVVWGSRDSAIVEELSPLRDEPVVLKTTGSAFLSSNLDSILRFMNRRSFVACGAWMNSCVEDTIRCGVDLGYLVTLAEDCSIAPDQQFHEACTRVLGSMYCQVKQSHEIIELLEKTKKK